MVVELRGDFLQSVEPCEGNVREIVVLNMVANVEEGDIEWSVVGVGGQVIGKKVVLANDVSLHRMGSKSKDGTHLQVAECVGTEEVAGEDIKGTLDDKVDHLPSCQRTGALEEWTDSVEEGVQEDPDEAKEGSTEEGAFDLQWNVHVKIFVSKPSTQRNRVD